MKLSYIKEMNLHMSKEISGYLKALDFKSYIYFNQQSVQFKASFSRKERQNKLHRF